MSNITDKEAMAIEVINKIMDEHGDGFSDASIHDIMQSLKWNYSMASGVLGSLIKKDLVVSDSVNDEYNIYYSTGWMDKNL